MTSTKFTNWMIDLETLSTEGDASIVQIGAVAFGDGTGDEDWTGMAFSRNVMAYDWDNIDGPTVLWWMNQAPEVRKHVLEQSVAVPLGTAINDLCVHIRNNSGGLPVLWAGPTTFDMVILKNAAKRVGYVWPFSFRDERCFSTLRKEFMKDEDERGLDNLEAMTHYAVADAEKQAIICQRILRRLRR